MDQTGHTRSQVQVEGGEECREEKPGEWDQGHAAAAGSLVGAGYHPHGLELPLILNLPALYCQNKGKTTHTWELQDSYKGILAALVARFP